MGKNRSNIQPAEEPKADVSPGPVALPDPLAEEPKADVQPIVAADGVEIGAADTVYLDDAGKAIPFPEQTPPAEGPVDETLEALDSLPEPTPEYAPRKLALKLDVALGNGTRKAGTVLAIEDEDGDWEPAEGVSEGELATALRNPHLTEVR